MTFSLPAVCPLKTGPCVRSKRPRVYRHYAHGRIIPSFFFKSSESDRFLDYWHDSNSIFRARRSNSEWVVARYVLRRNRVIFDHRTKRYYRSVKGHSEPPFTRCLPIRQEILNVSHIAVTFHGIRPPFVIQTRLQQHCRRTFFHSAYCSVSNPFCFRSVSCRRTMIPG